MGGDAVGGDGAATGWRGIGFRVGDLLLVTPLAAVGEVRSLPPLARVPGAHAWLLGVGNANGRLLPVTDLGLYAGLGPCTPGSARVVVVEREGHLAGLAVDAVSGVETYVEVEDEGDTPVVPERLAACLGPIARCPDGRGCILDVQALVRQQAFREAGVAS